MRFIHYIYKYTPTYRVTLPRYPTRETKVQIGMAIPCTQLNQLQHYCLWCCMFIIPGHLDIKSVCIITLIAVAMDI